MADKKLNEVTKVTDMAYVPVIMADGSIGQIAKADLASVVAGMLPDNTLGIRRSSKNLNTGESMSLNYGNSGGILILRAESNEKIGCYLLGTQGGLVTISATPGDANLFTITNSRNKVVTITNNHTTRLYFAALVISV